MCLIIAKPAGKSIPVEYIREAWRCHHDGFGIVAAVQGNLISKRGADDIDEIISLIGHSKPFPALIHFRLATSGRKDKSNCHPFWINNQLVLAHNGIFHIKIEKTGDSDTKAYVRWLRAFLPRFGNDPLHPEILRLSRSTIGYSIVKYLMADGTFLSINGDKGHTDESGIWYSNYSYKVWTPTTTKIRNYPRHHQSITVRPPNPHPMGFAAGAASTVNNGISSGVPGSYSCPPDIRDNWKRLTETTSQQPGGTKGEGTKAPAPTPPPLNSDGVGKHIYTGPPDVPLLPAKTSTDQVDESGLLINTPKPKSGEQIIEELLTRAGSNKATRFRRRFHPGTGAQEVWIRCMSCLHEYARSYIKYHEKTAQYLCIKCHGDWEAHLDREIQRVGGGGEADDKDEAAKLAKANGVDLSTVPALDDKELAFAGTELGAGRTPTPRSLK